MFDTLTRKIADHNNNINLRITKFESDIKAYRQLLAMCHEGDENWVKLVEFIAQDESFIEELNSLKMT